jgi:nucleoporin NDC1
MASLQEDRYGVAQADIPKILEGLVTYLSTLESYTKELNQLADDGKFPSAVVRTAVSGSIQPLVDALRDGIAGIAHTFRAYLDDLKLPPSVATRVKGFL